MTTVQRIFQQFYFQYREEYTPYAQQLKVINAILNCKTEALGGHVGECDNCGHTKIWYNSCRNRHCPMCQGVNKAVWVDKQSENVLDAPYFHLVFTMPEELRELIYQNQKLLYDLMYKAVAQTCKELSGDKKYLGARIGFFSLLHTWGQALHYHPHIHTVVLAGGLTKHNQWRTSSKKFFIPVKVLSKKFRGKFLYYLKQYYNQGLLNFYGKAKQYRNSKGFLALLDQCYSKGWYSYTKRTFSGPLAVIKYLASYTHQIAIANQRIISMDKEFVTIAVKDYKDGNKGKTITMRGVEFMRRFLMHVLPKRFVKIRHYGLLANRTKKKNLAICRQLTGSPAHKSKFEGLKTVEILCLLLGKDITLCPVCKKGKMQKIRTLKPAAAT